MKIAFIGFEFHKKTLSSKFFIENIKQNNTIELFWSADPQILSYDIKNELENNNFDVLVFWQIIPSKKELERFICQNIILIPMYDAILNFNTLKFISYKNYRFISFSKTLHNILLANGLKSFYIKYAINPKLFNSQIKKEPRKKPKLFFWQRKNDITWETIKKIINYEEIDSVTLHLATDPGIEAIYPSDEDIKNFNITSISTWFDDKNDLIKNILDCDIYIAPRKYEGIGMSFLEAMSMGLCVIASDTPTMNEYIVHNKNGLLFDIENQRKLDLKEFRELKTESLKYMYKIYEEWEKNKKEIISYLTENTCESLITSNLEKKIVNKKEYAIDLLEFSYIYLKKEIDNLYIENKEFKFSADLNQIILQLEELSSKKEKYLIYGAGNFHKIIDIFLNKKINGTVDKSSTLISTKINKKAIYSPENIYNMKYDKIIISVLGREEEISNYLINELHIDKSKIIFFSLP